TQRVRWRVVRLGADRGRGVELRQLEPTVAIRGPHHHDVDADVVETDDAVDPPSLDGHPAVQLHAKFGKERESCLEVVHNEADVVHPLDRHGLEDRDALGGAEPSGPSNPAWQRRAAVWYLVWLP